MVTGASTADCAVDPHRRAQGRAHADAPAQLPRLAARHPPRRRSPSTRWTSSTTREERLRRDRARLPRVRRPARASTTSPLIPLSALRGDNVIERAARRCRGTRGPTLMEHLETVEVDQERMQDAPFRLPVQWVNRPNSDFRGFAGTIAGGRVAPGDRVVVLPAGRESDGRRASSRSSGDLDAGRRRAVGDADARRRDRRQPRRRDRAVDDAAARRPTSSRRPSSGWREEPLLRGRTYLMQRRRRRRCRRPSRRSEVQARRRHLEQIAANELDLNEIGVVQLELGQPVAFDPYVENRDTGGFILIDRITNHTVGAGLLASRSAARERRVGRQLEVDREARAALKAQTPVRRVADRSAGRRQVVDRERRRAAALRLGRHTVLLDGANLRHGSRRISASPTPTARRTTAGPARSRS